LLEFNPVEGWKTNVVGTRNVLEAAEAHEVARLVNISTDKAADPTSVLGFVKRICERMTAASAADTGHRYVSVRFGNVLGSQGSMLSVFERQIAIGGPVTVTHPDVTRYFMTTEEAVALTIQAGAVGRAGEVLVLDMGNPVRIEEVARRLAEQAGVEPEIVYTGLRPGEKLHEVLFGAGEIDVRPYHELISHVHVPPLRYDEARAMCSVDGRLILSRATLEVTVMNGLYRDDDAQPESSATMTPDERDGDPPDAAPGSP
jgi:FlaA1/EpsC-like NDP-sugar epimerase